MWSPSGARAGQALVEAAYVALLFAGVLCVAVALVVVLRGAIGVQAAGREAALAAAGAASAEAALAAGQARGVAVAADYGLAAGDVTVVVGLPEGFARGARVDVTATARIGTRWLPLVPGAGVVVAARASERIDRYRSLGP
jgi:hypothetical protein